MILERLALRDFGVYRGRHVVDLSPPPPSQAKPVILIGGLNGGGKTTFLDALQLALYGKMAGASNRADLPYEEYLRRTVNRGVDPQDGAALEIQLRRTALGKEETIAVRRSWSVRERSARERLEVCRNDALDTLLTDAWAEHIEELLPVRLSRFFFFDGEKIEALADVDRSAEVLQTAIHVLLGLDLVDQLLADLLVLERRKRTEQKGATERRAVEAMKVEVDRLEEQREKLIEERAAAQVKLDRAQRALLAAEERFQLGGGDAHAQRGELTAKRGVIEEELRRVEEALRAEAEGAAPLLLVADLLTSVAADDESERMRAEARRFAELLATRDARVLAAVEAAGATIEVLKALAEAFGADRRDDEGAPRAYPALSTEARSSLASVLVSLSAGLPERLRRALDDAARLLSALYAADRRLTSVPEAEAIEALATQRSTAKEDVTRAEHALRAIDEELSRVTREHEHKWDAYARRLEEAFEEQSEAEALTRLLTCSQRARETMKRFRGAVLDKRVRLLESLVLEGFQYLLRKPSLVTGLAIDPETFTMTLYGADRRELSPERLSAGERQLLAVSIIWALARASGRRLPVVIDTPLGRLDSVHRDRLVERYFPHASHQVILLSTDEEIDERQHAKLAPHIGRSYVIRHDDRAGTSTLSPGYFF